MIKALRNLGHRSRDKADPLRGGEIQPQPVMVPRHSQEGSHLHKKQTVLAMLLTPPCSPAHCSPDCTTALSPLISTPSPQLLFFLHIVPFFLPPQRGSSSTQQVEGKDEHTHLGPSKLFLDADIVGFNVSSKFEVVDSVFMTTVNSLGRKSPAWYEGRLGSISVIIHSRNRTILPEHTRCRQNASSYVPSYR